MTTAASDFGYDESLSWTFSGPRLKPRTVLFNEESALVGPFAAQLLDAAKRLYVHSSPWTIENAIAALRLVVRAIHRHAGEAPSVLECEQALVTELAESPAQGRRHNAYKMAVSILRESARAQGLVLKTRNPFPRRNNPISTAPRAELKQLIQIARVDAANYFRDLTDPSSWKDPEVVLAAREFVAQNGGLLPDHSGSTSISAKYAYWIRRVSHETGHLYSTRLLSRYCYAICETLLPYYILLTYKLAANVDSVALMTRNCMRAIDNPVLGKRFLVDLPKGRSPGMPPYSVSDYGALSVPWLIRAVLAFTDPLVPLAKPEHQRYLFLAYSRNSSVLPFMSLRPSAAFRRYKKSRHIESSLTLNMLRPTRLADEYAHSLDPFRVKRIAQHKHLRETMRYLDHPEVAAIDDTIIANAQSSIFEARARNEKFSRAGDTAQLGSHECDDPKCEKYGVDENGLCANLLWPLNDRHFVMRLEPRAVAFLLRDYDALCEAQTRLPSERYQMIYLKKRILIESQYLPLVDGDLMKAAREIVPTLPPLRRID